MRAFIPIMALYIAAISSPAFAAALSSDDDIRHALVGNTISGEEDGQAFTEYFKPDGTIAGEEADGRYAGHWHIAGSQMCLRYEEDDGKEGNWECLRVDVDGTRVTWLSEGEATTSATLTPGNPGKF